MNREAIIVASFLSALCAGCGNEPATAEIPATFDQKAKIMARYEVAPMDAMNVTDAEGRKFLLVHNKDASYTATYADTKATVTFAMDGYGNTVYKSGDESILPAVAGGVFLMSGDPNARLLAEGSGLYSVKQESGSSGHHGVWIYPFWMMGSTGHSGGGTYSSGGGRASVSSPHTSGTIRSGFGSVGARSAVS